MVMTVVLKRHLCALMVCRKKTTTLLSCEGAEKVISPFEVVTGKQFVAVEQRYGFRVMCHCSYY